eukprot:jgi/Ulvmu1/2370/UM130_0001.1
MLDWVLKPCLAFVQCVCLGDGLGLLLVRALAIVQAQPLLAAGSMKPTTTHSAASRRLQQGNTTVTSQAPALPSGLSTSAAGTVVTTVEGLHTAVFTQQARDIVIQAHLDLRGMDRSYNPVLPQNLTGGHDARQGLLYARTGMRSMRGNCSDPDAAAALGLSQAEAAAMVPLKPRQCVIIVPDRFLVSNGDSYLVDNLYLKLHRQRPSALFSFLLAGAITHDYHEYLRLTSTDFYVTNVTFQGEHRGSAYGVLLETQRSRMLMRECIMTDWSGDASPLGIFSQGKVTVVDTVFRNMRLSVEAADVSGGSTVRFVGVRLANVTLTHGRIVSTSNNDYSVWSSTLEYYAEDDAAYDVDAAQVSIAERDQFGAEFAISDQVMSDCIYLEARPETIMPGCPHQSLAKRREVRHRIRNGHDLAQLEQSYAPSIDGDDGLLWVDARWMVDTLAALGPLPPPPPGWPPFVVPAAGEPVARASLAAELPVPPWEEVPPFKRTPAAVASAEHAATAFMVAEERTEGQRMWVPLVAAVWVIAAVAALGACLAMCAARMHPPLRPSKELKSGRRRQAAHGTGHITGVLPNMDSMPHGTASTACGWKFTRGTVPRSVMNPMYEYALPTRVARLMVGPTVHTGDAAAPMAVGDIPSLRDRPDCHAADRMAHAGRAEAAAQGGSAALQRRQQQHSWQCSRQHGSAGCRSCARITAAVPSEAAQQATDLIGSGAGTPYNVQPESAAAPKATHSPTIGVSNDVWPSKVSRLSLSQDTLALPLPGAELLREMFGMRLGRARERDTGTDTRQRQSWFAPLPRVSTVNLTTEEATEVGQMTGDELIALLHRQLDAFGEDDLFLGRFVMLGRQQRRRGGQAVVQFAEGATDHCQYAIKFFLCYEAFLVEAALYAACFPHVRAEVSDEVLARADATAGLTSSGDAAIPMSDIVARFLPQVDAVCDGSAGGLEDPRRRPLPPCIIMEKGESLHDWSNRAVPDLFTSLAVLSNISERLADMHAAGYVHRDLKPANVMWLPRANRWTVIDFGCVARAGEVAPLNFTLAYAAPEVVRAFYMQQHYIVSAPTLDMWSLGVMAFELLTGAPAYNLLSDGRGRVMQRLRGDLPLPWEGELSPEVRRHLGAFEDPILKLLQREPGQRISMREFHVSCTNIFATRTTVEA